VKTKLSIILFAAVLAALSGVCALAQTGNGHAEPPDTGGIFTDVPKDHWAYDDLTYLAERGLIAGLPGGKFDGDSPADRYWTAVMIARAIRYMQNSPESVTPDDLNVLKDLIFQVSDDLDKLQADVDAIGGGTATGLETRVAQNEQDISSLESQIQDMSTSSPTSLAKRVQANFIISLTALLIGIIGVALATLGL